MKTIAQLNILSNYSKQPSFFTGTDSNSFFLTNTTFNRRWLFYFSYLLSPLFYSQVHEGKAFSLTFEQSFTAQYQYIEFMCVLKIYLTSTFKRNGAKEKKTKWMGQILHQYKPTKTHTFWCIIHIWAMMYLRIEFLKNRPNDKWI